MLCLAWRTSLYTGCKNGSPCAHSFFQLFQYCRYSFSWGNWCLESMSPIGTGKLRSPWRKSRNNSSPVRYFYGALIYRLVLISVINQRWHWWVFLRDIQPSSKGYSYRLNQNTVAFIIIMIIADVHRSMKTYPIPALSESILTTPRFSSLISAQSSLSSPTSSPASVSPFEVGTV